MHCELMTLPRALRIPLRRLFFEQDLMLTGPLPTTGQVMIESEQIRTRKTQCTQARAIGKIRCNSASGRTDGSGRITTKYGQGSRRTANASTQRPRARYWRNPEAARAKYRAYARKWVRTWTPEKRKRVAANQAKWYYANLERERAAARARYRRRKRQGRQTGPT